MGVGKRFQYRIKVLSARRNPALSDMQSCIDLTGEPQDLGPASKILFSTSTSEIVIFKVCFPFYKSLLERMIIVSFQISEKGRDYAL